MRRWKNLLVGFAAALHYDEWGRMRLGAADDQETDDSADQGANVPTVEELIAERGQAFEAMDQLVRTAEEEERTLTDDERGDYAQRQQRCSESTKPRESERQRGPRGDPSHPGRGGETSPPA
jgi:hypothetical protein